MRETAALPILLKELRLPTIGKHWEPIIQEAEKDSWSYAKFLTRLCEHEVEVRAQKKIQTYTKKAKLPKGKSISTFDFGHVKQLNKAKLDDLINNTNWVDQAENVLIFGPSGVGKTHLASAIGYSVIEKGKRALFISATALVQNLQSSRRDFSLPAALTKLDKYHVIILDDIGYVRKDEAETHVLFELIAERYESGSLIITSNQPFSEWNNIFATTSMTVAAIDRLVHHATILEIDSESYRKTHSLKQQ